MASVHDFSMKHKDPRDPYVLPQVPEDDPVFYAPAMLIQHPRAKVVFDQPTPESVAAAKADMERERAAIGWTDADDPYERLQATETIRAYVQRYGADRVIRWVRFAAYTEGQSMTEAI